MKIFDVCVIGGGASGTVCSILLSQMGINVCLIDKNDSVAKKLLVTGNGRCNLTNKNISSKFYNQKVDSFLSVFNCESSIKMFKQFGLECYFDSEGRYYPLSNEAKSVVKILQYQFKHNGATFFSNSEVSLVTLKDKNYIVNFGTESLVCKNIVFATGGNFDFSKVLKNFEVNFTKNYPSLVALKTVESTKRLSGIRIYDVKITTTCNNNSRVDYGEVLFKENGLSGICVFNASTLFARNCCNFGKISINLLPKLEKMQIFDMIYEKMHIFEYAKDLMLGIFNVEIAREIFKRTMIDEDAYCKDVSKLQIDKLVDVIQNFDFNVNGVYQNSQVSSGGVRLDSLTSTLMSKSYEGLYFCGEICNVDGECGGYNLQWAWTSANIVAKDILTKYSKK